MCMEKPVFYPWYRTASRRPECLPNSSLSPSRPVLWFLAPMKALCHHKNAVVQPQVRVVGAPQKLWKECLFFRTFCFPGLCKVPAEAECCDLVYPEPLHTVAVTSSWNKFVKLFPGYLGIRTPAESSPKVPQACIWLCVLRDTALTWRTAGCSIRSRTKR